MADEKELEVQRIQAELLQRRFFPLLPKRERGEVLFPFDAVVDDLDFGRVDCVMFQNVRSDHSGIYKNFFQQYVFKRASFQLEEFSMERVYEAESVFEPPLGGKPAFQVG